jgi:pimeloyl-ACP methyl ester carboxylesterase
MIRRVLVAAPVLTLALALSAFAQSAPAASVPSQPKNNYANTESWLCRPGHGQDACAVDLATTVVAADGTMTKESWSANRDAAIDCFYVYPTVSLDPTPNSDMNAGVEERRVVQSQFARFGSHCRLFAPLYRQVTLTALRANTLGTPMAVDRNLAYNDVVDAWRHYLATDNEGRGVVLIGHSQGSGVLTRLIREEIDGKPIQSRLVSALLLGTNVAVPRGKDVGGAFTSVPLCRSPQQIGCVVAYVTFRSTIPPPADSRFGRVQQEGMEAACTNPAALGGGAGELHAYLVSSGRSITGSSAEQPSWVKGGAAVGTPYVSVPGLLSGQCVNKDGASYFEVAVKANPADPRADDIAGDVITNGKVNPGWGLHLIDVQVALGNLVELVGQQSRAYRAKSRSR